MTRPPHLHPVGPHPDDDRQATLLNRYLDDLLVMDSAPPAGLDDELADLARRTRGLTTSSSRPAHRSYPRHHHTMQSAIWRDLMDASLVAPSPIDPAPAARPRRMTVVPAARPRWASPTGDPTAPGPIPPASATGPAGRRLRSRQGRWGWRGWPAVEVLGAAALVIVLVAVLVGGGGQDTPPPTAVPQWAGAATALAGSTPAATTAAVGVGEAPPEIRADSGLTGVMPGPAPAVPLALSGPISLGQQPFSDGSPGDAEPFGVRLLGDLAISIFLGEGDTGGFILQARAIDDGAFLWSTPVVASPISIAGVVGDTLVITAGADGMIQLIVGDAPVGEPGRDYALGLDAATGAVRWATPVTDGPTGGETGNATVMPDGGVVIPVNPDRLVALNSSTGAVRWDVVVPVVNAPRSPNPLGQAAVDGGVVVVPVDADAALFALDAMTGAALWDRSFADSETFATPALVPAPPASLTLNGPVIANGTVYLTTGSQLTNEITVEDRQLFALDARIGLTRWEQPLPTLDSTGQPPISWGPPRVAEGAVLVGDGQDGAATVRAFDPATGTPLWQTVVAGTTSLALSIVGDTAYAAGGDGYLTAIDLTDGAQRWSFTFGFVFGPVAAPFIVDGTISLLDADGNLYRLIAYDGAAVPGDAATPLALPATPITENAG